MISISMAQRVSKKYTPRKKAVSLTAMFTELSSVLISQPQ